MTEGRCDNWWQGFKPPGKKRNWEVCIEGRALVEGADGGFECYVCRGWWLRLRMGQGERSGGHNAPCAPYEQEACRDSLSITLTWILCMNKREHTWNPGSRTS